MKVSFPEDEKTMSKTITLPPRVLEKAAGRARKLRRTFSNYVRVLIEDDNDDNLHTGSLSKKGAKAKAA